MDITATFAYDPRPEGLEPRPYGFRFARATVTPTHPGGGESAEYTDVYDFLDRLITGLYGQS